MIYSALKWGLVLPIVLSLARSAVSFSPVEKMDNSCGALTGVSQPVNPLPFKHEVNYVETFKGDKLTFFKAFCDHLIILEPGPNDFPGTSAGAGMIRQAPPFHQKETVTRFDLDTLFHRYEVTEMMEGSPGKWSGFIAELSFEEEGGYTTVIYNTWMILDPNSEGTMGPSELKGAVADLFQTAAKA